MEVESPIDVEDESAVKKPKTRHETNDVHINSTGLKNQNHSKTPTSEDDAYFSTYTDIGIHEDMLADRVRTNAYRLAILKNYEKIRGKVVLDVGAGTGILSMFCIEAGAKKVYAVEASGMASQIRLVAKENEVSDRIVVINSKVEEATLPEKVDVIVSEWMGYTLLYESMLPSVLLARDKWLKPGGVMLPERAKLFLAPFAEDEILQDRLEFWDDVKDMYHVKMSSMKSYTLECMSRQVHVRHIMPETIQSHACVVCDLDLCKVTVAEVTDVKGQISMQCFGHNQICGFVTWFKVYFPQNIELSTSPYDPSTHWEQGVLYLKEPFNVKQDTEITGTLTISANKEYQRFTDFNMEYSTDKQTKKQAFWKMDAVLM